VRRDDDPARKKPWGVFWNEYTAGRVGRPQQRAKFFATEAEAEETKRIVVAELAQPMPITAPVRTHRTADSLATFAEKVWLPFAKDRTAGTTYKGYKDCFNNWIAPESTHARYPGLGNVILSDTTLTKDIVIAYLEGLHAKKVSLSMRRRLKGALSACCGHAFYVGRLTLLNPCSKLGKKIAHKGERDADPEPNPFSPDEIAAIFDQLMAIESLYWQVYFLWQYHVGTRPGEAAALKWTALKLDRKRGRIEYAYCPVDKIDKDPKTHERRDVDLTAELVTLLVQWRAVQREVAFRRGYPSPEYVFTTEQPSRIAPRQLARILQGGTVRAVFTRTMKACGITGHTPYNFRDSFATSHLAMGWDRKLAWVSKQLGHSTPIITAKTYYAYRDTVASRTFADEIGSFK
jgi:integrase